MSKAIEKCVFLLFLPLQTGESGGQESLFSGDSLCFAFAFPELRIGLEGGLEPRLFVGPLLPPTQRVCVRVGLL